MTQSEFHFQKAMIPGMVSVITPCLNGRRYLEAAVNSVLAQSYRNFEILIVDNGSTDGSLELARSFLGPIQVFCEEKRGLPNARNHVLPHLRGEFIQLLDCDDILHPLKFAKQIETFRNNPTISAVYSNANFFETTLEEVQTPVEFIRDAANHLIAFFSRNLFPPVAALVRRAVYEKVGHFDSSLPALEDWDYWFRAATFGFSFMFTRDVLSYYRQHPSQMTQNKTIMLRGTEILLDKMERFVSLQRLTPPIAISLLDNYLNLYFTWTTESSDKALRRKIETRLLELFDLLWEEPIDARIPDSELAPLEVSALLLQLGVVLRRMDHPAATGALEEGFQSAIRFLEKAPQSPASTQALDRKMYQGFCEVIRAEDVESIRRFQHFMKILVRKYRPEQAARMFPVLSIDRIMEPILKIGLNSGWKKIGFYGAGMHTARLLGLVDLHGLPVTGIIDDNAGNWGSRIFGIPVMSMEDLIRTAPDAVIISSDAHEQKMYERCDPLRRASIEVVRIYGA
jgi:glycosyltransferase involved in cell wall biosynthesis